MGKKSVPTFRECVDARYQNDLVMNGFATFLVMLVPLLVLLVVYLLSRTDTVYGVLSDYMEKVPLRTRRKPIALGYHKVSIHCLNFPKSSRFQPS